MHRSVTIDGQIIRLTPFDNNIVDLASRVKIKIPAPCYRTQRGNGCCRVCVIAIDGKQKYACSTIPQNEMNIVVDRADLKAIRKQRLLEYKRGIKSENPCKCSLSSSDDCCGWYKLPLILIFKYLIRFQTLQPLVLGHGKIKRVRITESNPCPLRWLENEGITSPYNTICKNCDHRDQVSIIRKLIANNE